MTVNQLNARVTFTSYYFSWRHLVLHLKLKKYFNSVEYIVIGNYSARYIFKEHLRQKIPRKDMYNLHDKD